MYFLSVSPKAVHSECVAHAGSTTDSLVRAPSERLVDTDTDLKYVDHYAKTKQKRQKKKTPVKSQICQACEDV